MWRIRKEERLMALKKRVVFFSIIMGGSIIAFIPALGAVQAEISQSGFLQFLSLIFSDFEIIINYWQSFVISLLETIPAISIAIFLAVIFVFLESLKFLARDIKIIYGLQQIFSGKNV